MFRKFLFLFASLFIWGSDCFAQASAIRFRQLNDKDGLSCSQVTCFAQSPGGLMWIGTANGLNSYDGFRFRQFLKNQWDSQSIADSYIQCLLAAGDHSLWAGGHGVISMLPAGKSDFAHFVLPGSRMVYTFYEDNDDRIWAGADNGLYLFDREQGQFEKITGFPVYDIDLKQPYLILCSQSSLYAFDIIKKKITGNYTDQFTALGGMMHQPSTISALQEQLFISNPLGGFFAANTQTEKYKKLLPPSISQLSSACNAIDSLGNVWVGTAAGLYIYYPADSALQPVKEFIHSGESLISHQHILSLFFDHAGMLWIATRDAGLFQAGSAANRFLPYSTAPFPSNRITALRMLHEKEVLIGTETDGLYEWPYPGGSPQKNKGLPANKVSSIASAPHAAIWLGTEKGLYEWDRNKNTFKLHKLYTDTLKQEVTSVADVNDDNIFLGTNYGLVRYQPSSKDVYLYTYNPAQSQGISKGRVNVVFRDRRNRLWVGTDNGLDLFISSSQIFEHYTQALNLKQAEVADISEDAEGMLWIALSSGGLVKLNPQNHKSQQYLQDIFCRSVRISPDRKIWVGTINSIICFNPADGTHRSFKTADGLASLEHMPHSLAWLGNGPAAIGLFAAGTASGLYTVNTSYHPATSSRLQFTVSHILIDGKPGSWTGQSFRINPENRQLIIRFGTNDFADPYSHHLWCKLDGFDKEWRECDHGEVIYNRLPEGNYALLVREKEGEPVTLIQLEVIPPFWASFAFRILLLVVLLGLGWWLMSSWISNLKKQENKKHELDKRMLKLEVDACRAQLDSQYISNVLYAIRDCLENKNIAAAQAYLSKFSSLLSSIMEFSDKEFISIDQLWKAMDYYLAIEKMKLGNELEYRIEISPEIDRHTVLVPNMMVQPYVENAVYFGLRQKIKDRRILLRFDPWSKNHVLCTIEDNGIGRKVASGLRASRIDFHGSSHTRIAEERMQIMEQTRGLETRLEVIDLYNEKGEAAGTKVILHLPVSNENKK